MMSLPAGSRIWIVAGITDMRKGFNGLASRVQNTLRDNTFSGQVFMFRAAVDRRRWPVPVHQTPGARSLRLAVGEKR